MIGSSNGETNFPDKLFLTNKQVSEICKAFENGSPANIKFLKTLLSKIVQLGGFIFPLPIWGSSDLRVKKILSSAKSFANLYVKELKNTGDRKLSENSFVHVGLSLLSKKIKKGISLIPGLGDNFKK